MKILFICKYNHFRSKIAEAIFNQLNKNPKHIAQSAGILPGYKLTKKTINEINQTLKEVNLKISNKTKGLNHNMFLENDKIVIVADNIPKSLFSEEQLYLNKEIIHWDIKDAHHEESNLKEKRIKMIKLIKDKTITFIENLEKN